MTKIVLRDYQKEALDSIKLGYSSGYLNQLVVAATGTGKTTIFSHVKKHLGLTGPVLILAELATLLDQAKERWLDINPGEVVGLEQGTNKLDQEMKYDVILGSLDTLRGKRLEELAKREFSLVIYDEAHHSPSPSSVAILTELGLLPVLPSGRRESNKRTLLLGVTATPNRSDKQSLEKIFPYRAYDYTMFQALESGAWSPVRARRILTNSDLSSVKVNSMGVFDPDSLSKYLDTEDRNEQLYKAWKDSGGEQGRTIIFASTREHAKSLSSLFGSRHRNVWYIDGTTSQDDRKHILYQFKTQTLPTVLSNVALISEGVDVPEITHIIAAYPIQSPIKMEQGLGRGTRPLNGKDHLTVLYTVDQSVPRVRVYTPPSLLGLPSDFDLEGEDMLSIKRELDTMVEESPVSLQALLEAGSLPDTMPGLRKLMEELPLFCPTDLSGAIKGLTNFAWLINDPEALLAQDFQNAEKYVLQIPAPRNPAPGEPKHQRTVHLDKIHGVWHYRLYGPTKEKAQLQEKIRRVRDDAQTEPSQWRKYQLYSKLRQMRDNEKLMPDQILQDVPLDRDLAKSVRKVDEAISSGMPSALPIIRLDARWRHEKPSPGQLSFAKKLSIPVTKEMTKGSLTSLIDHAIRRKANK